MGKHIEQLSKKRQWDTNKVRERQAQRKLTTVESLDGEVWEDVVGFEGIYMVSNLARVKRLARLQPNKHGTLSVRADTVIKYSLKKKYSHVALYTTDSKKVYKLVHRLVAEAFIPNPENKPEVNHKKGRKEGHHVGNLEWATKSENETHAHVNGLKIAKSGETHYACKLSSKQIKEIRKKYKWRVYTSPMLAAEYGVSQSHIILIIHGKNRKNG